MKPLLPPALLLLLAMVPACGGQSVPAQAAPTASPSPATSASAMPSAPGIPAPRLPVGAFDVGRKWLFETIRVEGNVTDRGTCTIEIVKRDGDQLVAHVVSLGGTGRPAEGLLARSSATSPLALPALLPTHGGTYITQIPASELQRGVANVTVPAGSFAATHTTIQVPSPRSCCMDQITLETWADEATGLVKAVETFVPGAAGGAPGPDAVPITTTYELVRAS